MLRAVLGRQSAGVAGPLAKHSNGQIVGPGKYQHNAALKLWVLTLITVVNMPTEITAQQKNSERGLYSNKINV